jgi:hypothetical protein
MRAVTPLYIKSSELSPQRSHIIDDHKPRPDFGYRARCSCGFAEAALARSLARFCRISRVCVDQFQSGWRSVMVAVGGPTRARVSAQRSALGSRYRSAMRRTRSAASAAGNPAAVTTTGVPRIRA